MRELISIVVVVSIGACGWLPADAPPKKPVTVDADATALVHTWIVADHFLVKGSSVSDEDARGFHGRTIEITATGFMTPWQGTCEDAGRTRRIRPVGEFEMGPQAHGEITGFGLGEALREYRFSCNDPGRRPPPLTIYVSNERAMTCFGGACYLMKRF